MIHDWPGYPANLAACALFLDVDGTLVSICAHPDDVAVDAELAKLVVDLEDRLQGALALISGRSLASLDALFAPRELTVAGSHGTEIRRKGQSVEKPVKAGDALAAVLDEAERFTATNPGLLLERKAAGLTLHYRARPELADAVTSFVETKVAQLGDEFSAQDGKMVVEIVARHHDKGSAVATLMAAAPFANKVPVFIGDDTTDEAGFQAVNREGGLSIRVGVPPAHETAAQFWLADVPTVRHWLAQWLKSV